MHAFKKQEAVGACRNALKRREKEAKTLLAAMKSAACTYQRAPEVQGRNLELFPLASARKRTLSAWLALDIWIEKCAGD
jgi:hypothetical protein